MKKLFFLLMTVVCALLYAPPASAWTVYLDPANVGDNPTVHLYGGDGDVAEWASKPTMKKASDGRWYYDSDLALSEKGYAKTKTPGYVIFVKSDGTQTKGDNALSFTNGYTYTWDGNGGSTPSGSEWTEYTIYVDKGNVSWSNIYLYLSSQKSKVAPADLGQTDVTSTASTKFTLVSGSVYKISFATGGTAPAAMFHDGTNQWNSHQTEDIGALANNHLYKLTANGSNKAKVSDDGVYNPVSVTSVELLKDGVSIASDHGSYQFSLNGLKGTEKFLIKVNYDNSTSKTYTVSSGTSLTEGSTPFALDSKIINTVMIVRFSGTAATSYTLTGTDSDAVTSVTLDGASPIVKTSAPYTFTGVANDESGYTVIVKTKRDTEGTSYTFTNSAATAGNYTLTPGETPFHVDASLAKFNATVTVNSSTLKATSITIANPAAVITEVSIVSHDGSQNYTLTSKDGGLTWTGHSKVKAYDGAMGSLDSGDNAAYKKSAAYHIAVKNAGVDEKWYYNSSDTGLSKETTYSSNWRKATGTEFFRFANAGNETDYQFTVTLSTDKKSIASFRYKEYEAPAAEVYMPLSEKDFVNNDGTPRPHYFIVGQRTADWCLQPEWELAVNGNTATLSGRFMYQGYFGIAMVDNYDDYVMQRYTLYYRKTDVNACKGSTSGSQTITLSNNQISGAIDYGNKDKYTHNGDNSIRWQATAHIYWTNNDDPNNGNWEYTGSGTDFNAQSMKVSKPALLTGVTLTLSNGIPQSVKFDYDFSEAIIAANKSMTLVGSNIRYVGNYDFGKTQKNLDEMGRAWNGGLQKVTGWANSWIQSDAQGRPYVDGRGNTVYLTAYDKNWLTQHTTVFYNKDKDLIYDSESVTFLPPTAYDDYDKDTYKWLYTAHPATSQNIGGGTSISLKDGASTYSYKEVFPNYYGTTTSALNNSNWQCLVIKDMWLQGKFKVWSGGGGAIKTGWEGITDYGNATNAFQWAFENGGHGLATTYKCISGFDLTTANGGNVTLYPTLRDVNGADFSTTAQESQGDATYDPQMKFYSRVVLWYNPTTGFKNSVLQFIEPIAEPVIQARYNTNARKKLRYNWWINIPEGDTSHDDKMVTEYKVYRLNPDGSEKLVETGNANRKVSAMKTENTALAFNDPESLTPGKYRYRVEAMIGGAWKKQLSNELPIHETRVPVTAEARQQMEGENSSLYTFNVELNVEPIADYLDDAASETKTVRDMMKYYVITADNATAARLSAATTKPFTLSQASANQVIVATGEYLPAGTWYYKQEIADKNAPAMTFVWKNVTPNKTTSGALLKRWTDDKKTTLAEINGNDAADYGFSVYLVSEDGEIPEWSILQFDAAPASTEVVAPASKLTVNSIALKKATERTLAKKSHNPMLTETHTDHLSGTRLLALEDDAREYKFENHIVYNRLNEVAADAGISALDVTDEVIANNSITYDIYVTKAETALSSTLSDASAHASLEGVDNKAIDMTLYDLPLNNITKVKAIDGTHEEILDGSASTYDSHLMVTYNVGGKLFVNDSDNADRDIQFNPGLDTFNPTAGSTALSRYKGEYYHNGKNPTNPNVKPCECDDPNCEPHKEHLGYFAHGVVDFTLGGIDNDSKNAYVSFHAQQPYYSHSAHNNGCYKEDNGWYKHSFAGTRAANGGKPVANWNNDLTANGRYLDGYEEYTEGDWEDKNDWSTIAVTKQHLPLHINPIYQFNSETDYNRGTINDNRTVLTAKFSVICPIVNPGKMSVEVKASASSAARRADAVPSRDFDSVYLMGVSKSVDVNLNGLQTTGVDDITIDIPADAVDAEYYNLQGIRIAHPAKGQIYIVRQGDQVSKVLY